MRGASLATCLMAASVMLLQTSEATQGMKVTAIRGQNAWYPNQLNHKAPLAPLFWPPEVEIELRARPSHEEEATQKMDSLRGGFLGYSISGANGIAKSSSVPNIRRMLCSSVEVEGIWHHDTPSAGPESKISNSCSPSFLPGSAASYAPPVNTDMLDVNVNAIKVLSVRDKHVWHKQHGVNQLPRWAGKVQGFLAA